MRPKAQPLNLFFSLERIIEKIAFNSWWVIVFFILCYAIYERSIHQHNLSFSQLHSHLLSLEQEKEKALSYQKELKLQINSQSDPAWIELTLMKKLGVVPEGQTKVYFMRS